MSKYTVLTADDTSFTASALVSVAGVFLARQGLSMSPVPRLDLYMVFPEPRFKIKACLEASLRSGMLLRTEVLLFNPSNKYGWGDFF